MHYLDSPIEFLKGVGPAKAELLRNELRVKTFYDLLHYYPFRHVDRSRFTPLSEADTTAMVQVKGRFTRLETVGAKRATRMVGTFRDEQGTTVEVVWFRSLVWLKNSLKLNHDYVLFGKPSHFNGKLQFTHPDCESFEQFSKPLKGGLEGVYNTTEKLKSRGLDSRGLRRLLETLLPLALPHIGETLPAYLRQKHGLIATSSAVQNIHFPENLAKLDEAVRTLKYTELFYLQWRYLSSMAERRKSVKGFVFGQVGELFNQFYQHHLPFALTEAQKRVVREIRKDLGSGEQMNRLLQGDVGSGKTMVALLISLIAVGNGYQSAVMAPTEILAQQHFESLSTLLAPLSVNVALITGSATAAYKRTFYKELAAGNIHIAIGTHALLEDKVQFKNLGLAVIDEQHRFGVAQRSRLWNKNTQPPHVLVMTATPIPRTLAMTVYGDLDVSVIDELPPGRTPIKTLALSDSQRLYMHGLVQRELDKGRQAYVVFPLIEESETLDYKDLNDGYEGMEQVFPKPRYHIAMVHGQQSAEHRAFEMNEFVHGRRQIMVATTVIEVGVNVPNATIMVIESAERFGLSQLHQLRGRVGRGAAESLCVLMHGHKLSAEARARLECMVKTTDGFVIAETDLKLRGPGDLMGTQQSGLAELQLANLVEDADLLANARADAQYIAERDPQLKHEALAPMAVHSAFLATRTSNWIKIS